MIISAQCSDCKQFGFSLSVFSKCLEIRVGEESYQFL